MESSGSSFIPQRPTKGKVAAKSFRKVYILSYVSIVMFFTVIIAAGGVYFYIISLESQLAGLKEELVSYKSSFNQTDLDRIKNLDQRIDSAMRLVESHASLTTVLRALENTVTDPVQILSFNYNRVENFRQPKLTLSAVATEFDQVIFQEQVLGNFPVTEGLDTVAVNLTTQPINPAVPELGTQEVVTVTLEADLSLSEINYSGSAAVPAAQQLPPTIPTTSGGVPDDSDFVPPAPADETVTVPVEPPVVPAEPLQYDDSDLPQLPDAATGGAGSNVNTQ